MAHRLAAYVDPVEMFPGVRRKTMAEGERVMVCEISFDPGGYVPEHQHPHEQAGYVVRGELVLTVAGTPITLRPGDGYVVPSNTLHSARALTECVVIDVFSPPREEYRLKNTGKNM
jgi:quercetin dioxygenase-like cupin family protein